MQRQSTKRQENTSQKRKWDSSIGRRYESIVVHSCQIFSRIHTLLLRW